ncbi:MAG: DUF1877 family protein [Bacteroidota bacterium]
MGYSLSLYRLPSHRLEAVVTDDVELIRYDNEFGSLAEVEGERPHRYRSELIGWLDLGKSGVWRPLKYLLDPIKRERGTWEDYGPPGCVSGAAVSGWHQAETGFDRPLRYNRADEVEAVRKALEPFDFEMLVRRNRDNVEYDCDVFPQPYYWPMLVERLEHLREFYRIAAGRGQAVLTDQE